MAQIEEISMASGFVIRRNQYYDSVFLMGISKRISEAKGVQQNAVLMGSNNHKRLLSKIGIQHKQIDAAHPNDLIVAVIADTPQIDDKPFSSQIRFTPQELAWMRWEVASWSSHQKYIRGLFASGTFCYQSQQISFTQGLILASTPFNVGSSFGACLTRIFYAGISLAKAPHFWPQSLTSLSLQETRLIST
jgi:hypothetical protein